MANWSGTYTITAGTTGTTTGGNTSTTFNNTLATWPIGAQSLANFVVRILSGAGIGQERVITSNTATQLTVPAWTTIPSTGDSYEIVLIFNYAASDHITASLILSTNVITEIANSSTLLFDGLFSITFSTSSLVRWNKSESTLVTLQPNNITVAGRAGFWGTPTFSATLTNAPMYSYVKVVGATNMIAISATQTVANAFAGIHHLWGQSLTGAMFSTTAGAQTQNMRIGNLFQRNSRSATHSFNSTASAGVDQILFMEWSEYAFTGATTWSSTGPDTKTMRDSVFKMSMDSSAATNFAAGKAGRFRDNYASSYGADSVIIFSVSGVASLGTAMPVNNTMNADRCGQIPAAVVLGTLMDFRFNDMFAVHMSHANNTLNNVGAGVTGSFTSDNDFIAGSLLADPLNVDTTAATTSTASPVQYLGLSAARTNPKSVRNKPLVIDNVVTGAPTESQVTVTFDSQNGAPNPSATVNVDSASGQPVLSVTATSDFSLGEVLEIGYGTARAETARILSISAGVSVTFETNLAFTHTAAQADTVRKRLRHWAFPRILYGTTSGIYDMSTSLPPITDWGLFYTGLSTTYKGTAYSWQQTGHSILLKNLRSSTTYFYKVIAYNPFEEIMESSEFSFSTAADTRYTNPGVANVRLATGYTFNGTPLVGTVRVPTAAQVQIGTLFDASDTLTGTYVAAERYTDPGIANVRLATTYAFNSTSPNRTGTVREPIVSDVRAGVVYGASDTLTGTFGEGTPPIFAGIASLVAGTDGSLTASWAAATDASPPIVYKVYIQANTATGLFSTTPFATYSTSLKMFTIPSGANLVAGTTYFVGVRATDAYNNSETNTATLSATSMGVEEGSIEYEAHCIFSINNINQLLVTGWLTGNSVPIKIALGTASLEIRDATDTVLPAFTQSGIAANADGAFIFAAVSAALLDAFTHYRVKIIINYQSQPFESSRGLTIFE